MAKPDQAVARGIRAARLERGMSLRELARRLDRSPSAISQIERGRIAPSDATLTAIAIELGATADELKRGDLAGPDRAARDRTQAVTGLPATPRGEPVRADARRNRATLLDAASALFAQKGLDASVAEIAAHADVTVATLFRHFASKQHLIEAIGQERARAIQQLIDHAVGSADIGSALPSLFERILEMQARDRGLVELIERVLSPELHAEMVAGWRRLLRRAQDAGVVRDDVTAEDVPFLLAASGGFSRLLGDARPDLTRRYARLLVDSLRPEHATALIAEPPSLHEVIDAYRATPGTG